MNTYDKIEADENWFMPENLINENHFIPDDYYIHIKSIGCNCNPQLVVTEGSEQYIHNKMDDTFNKERNESS